MDFLAWKALSMPATNKFIKREKIANSENARLLKEKLASYITLHVCVL